MAASLAAQQEAMFVHDVSDDEELSSAQVGYGASRNAKPRNSHRGEWKADSSSAATRTPSLPTILATPSVCAAEFHKSKPDVEPGSGRLTGFSVDRVQLEQERLARQAARQSQAQMTKVDEKHSTPPILPVKPNTRPAENGRSSGLTSHLSRSTQEASVAPGPPANGSKRSSNGVTHIAGPSREGDDGSRGSTRRGVPDRTTNHPLQSAEPFPVDEAGECYVDGEMRHTELTIGEPTTARTFSPSQVIGKVRFHLDVNTIFSRLFAEISDLPHHTVLFRDRRRLARDDHASTTSSANDCDPPASEGDAPGLEWEGSSADER